MCEMRFANDSEPGDKFPSYAVDCSTWRFSPAFSRHVLNRHDRMRLQRLQQSSVGPLWKGKCCAANLTYLINIQVSSLLFLHQ